MKVSTLLLTLWSRKLRWQSRILITKDLEKRNKNFTRPRDEKQEMIYWCLHIRASDKTSQQWLCWKVFLSLRYLVWLFPQFFCADTIHKGIQPGRARTYVSEHKEMCVLFDAWEEKTVCCFKHKKIGSWFVPSSTPSFPLALQPTQSMTKSCVDTKHFTNNKLQTRQLFFSHWHSTWRFVRSCWDVNGFAILLSISLSLSLSAIYKSKIKN